MIKVLHFVSTPAIWSGVMNVIMNYYRHMDRSRIQFDFLCFSPCKESYEAEIKDLGGNIYYVPKPGLFPNTIYPLIEFFSKNGNAYTWLHNHEVYLSFLLKPLSARMGIKNFIVHCHATKYSDHMIAAMRNYFLCLPVRRMTCNRFACSAAAGKFLYGKHSCYYILPNAIERQRFQYNPKIRKSYREQLNLNDSFVIGHIGRFVPQKNHGFLLDILEELQKRIPNTKLLLIGNGLTREKFFEQVEHRNLEKKIIFLNQRQDIPELLQAMDIYMLPSLYEGLPVSCLEAQAAGLTCLIADTVTPEIKLSERVLLLPLTDKNAWINACLYHFENINKSKRTCPSGMPDIIVEAHNLMDIYEKVLL